MYLEQKKNAIFENMYELSFMYYASLSARPFTPVYNILFPVITNVLSSSVSMVRSNKLICWHVLGFTCLYKWVPYYLKKTQGFFSTHFCTLLWLAYPACKHVNHLNMIFSCMKLREINVIQPKEAWHSTFFQAHDDTTTWVFLKLLTSWYT